MTKFYTIFCFIAVFLLSNASAQVVDPEEREKDLLRMREVLAFPGERDPAVLELSTNVFYPPFLYEMGPSPREILRQFSETLSLRSVTALGEDTVVIGFHEIGLIREGEEVPFDFEGETYNIVFSSLSESAYIISYEEVTKRIEL